MSAYDYLLTDPDITYYQGRVPGYNRIISRELGYMAATDVDPHKAKALLLDVLRDALRAYGDTEATTRTGRILRSVARFLSYLNPLSWKRTS